MCESALLPAHAGAPVALDGKTAAERRRETLAIQATLPPDLKICSSCRQARPSALV